MDTGYRKLQCFGRYLEYAIVKELGITSRPEGAGKLFKIFLRLTDGASRDRTGGLPVANGTLSQLSYGPENRFAIS